MIMLRGHILYLTCEYLNEKDHYNIAKINKECNEYIKEKYKDFRLTFKKYNYGDSFRYEIYIKNYDSKIFIKEIEYIILYKYRNLKIYGVDYQNDEKNLLSTIKKLKKKEYPIEYDMMYKDIEYKNVYFSMYIDKYKIKLNNSIIKTTNTLLESILVFFKNIIQSKIDYILDSGEMINYGVNIDQKNCIFYELYKSEYATEEYKKEYDRILCEMQTEEYELNEYYDDQAR